MEIRKLIVLSFLALSMAFADPVVSVSSSCTNSTCSGGVQPGTVFIGGVQSLDVYASATMAAVYVPPPGFGQVWDPFAISVDVTLQTYGSGPGSLVIDPFYSFTSPTPFPETLEADIVGIVNNANTPQIICTRPEAVPGSVVCSGETLIPITLGTQVNLVLEEGSNGVDSLPPGSTLSTDLDLWTVSANGSILPVTLAEAVPEPARFAIVGLSLLALVQLVTCASRRNYSRHRKLLL